MPTAESIPMDPRNAHSINEGTNLNIRENMKAGAGVTFTEGFKHTDIGPSYNDVMNAKNQRLTLDQYR